MICNTNYYDQYVFILQDIVFIERAGPVVSFSNKMEENDIIEINRVPTDGLLEKNMAVDRKEKEKSRLKKIRKVLRIMDMKT